MEAEGQVADHYGKKGAKREPQNYQQYRLRGNFAFWSGENYLTVAGEWSAAPVTRIEREKQQAAREQHHSDGENSCAQTGVRTGLCPCVCLRWKVVSDSSFSGFH